MFAQVFAGSGLGPNGVVDDLLFHSHWSWNRNRRLMPAMALGGSEYCLMVLSLNSLPSNVTSTYSIITCSRALVLSCSLKHICVHVLSRGHGQARNAGGDRL